MTRPFMSLLAAAVWLLSPHAGATNGGGNGGDAAATSGSHSSSQAGAAAAAGALSAAQASNITNVQAVTGPAVSSATGGQASNRTQVSASTGASTSSATGGASHSSANGGQGGNAVAGDSAASVTFNAPAAPASTQATIKAAPDVFVSGAASGPCTGTSGGVGASWLGGGLGFSAATVDAACTLRENIRVLAMVLPTLPRTDADELRALLMGLVRELAAQKPGATPQAAPQ